MDFLTDFGVQPVLLIAQVVNFLILLFLLKRFFYKPLLNVLEKRKQMIADSVKKAEEIEARLTEINKEREESLRKATQQANQMIENAAKNAETIVKEAHDKAQSDTKKTLERAEATIKSEREKMYSDLKGELSDLVTLSFERLAGKILTTEDQKKLIEESLKELKK